MPKRGLRRERLRGSWRERLLLEDGRRLILRPIELDDARALKVGFELLSPEEVRFRFLHPLRELTDRASGQLASPERHREFALVVAEDLPPGEALIGGVVRASIDAERKSAEFAVIVSRFIGRQGIGDLLMRRIIRWAKLKRLDTLYGDVLDDNIAMLSLASRLGFKRSHRHDEPGITRITLDLHAALPRRRPSSKPSS